MYTNSTSRLIHRGYDRISEIPNLITLCHKCHYNRHDRSQKINELGENKKEKRNLEIVKMLNNRYKSKEIAEKFGISRQRVEKIYKSYQH